jgi:shikimate dehydrogenase
MTRPYAEVIGDPIAQSKSPLIHNFWLGKLGIDAEYRTCHVRPEELADYFTQRRGDAEWRGCNITMPHKQAVIDYVDQLDPLAERAGAANTIIRGNNGMLSGFNTDVSGVAEPLSAMPIGGYPDHIATYAYIIGAGGAARGAIVGVENAGPFDIDIFNRTVEKAHPLAAMAGSAFGEAHPLEHLTAIRNQEDGPEDQRYSHIIINASSMGMKGNPPVPIDLTRFYPDTIVFDMVYSPLETPLLAQARRLGLRTIDGLEMLVGQAAAAFEKFFGQPAPRQHDAELRELLTA